MIYLFNNFELDTDNFSLKSSGSSLAIEPQVFNLIVYLITHHNKVITRDELFEKVWSGRVVSDATLSNHINSARTLLGDDGNKQAVIKTIRGRGYQFVAALKTSNTSSAHNSVDHPLHPIKQSKQTFIYNKYALLAALLLLVISASYVMQNPLWQNTSHSNDQTTKTIAVLPFRNISELKADDHFIEGFCGDLTAKMSKLADLKIISHLSVGSYLNADKSIEEMTSELNVSNLLIGTMQRAGDKIKINIQLIDVQTNKHLWAETYTRDLNLESMFLVQADVTANIAQKLQSILITADTQTP